MAGRRCVLGRFIRKSAEVQADRYEGLAPKEMNTDIGWQRAEPGDWFVTDELGRLRVERAKDFAKRYERADVPGPQKQGNDG